MKAQHLYYKIVPVDSLILFKDTLHKIHFAGDTQLTYRSHINYVLRFFPVIRYKQIQVIVKPSREIARIKPVFPAMFQSPEKRVYKIYFSSGTGSTLDSVLLKNLSLNAALGLIARPVGHVEDLTTSGFFDILNWQFRKLSRNARNKHETIIEQRLLEVGLGHQILSFRNEYTERLKIENWKDPAAYLKFAKQNANRYMEAEKIANFIADLPVYASNHYY